MKGRNLVMKKKFLSILGAMLIAGTLVGCSDTVEDVSTGEKVEGASTEETTENKEEAPENKVYKVGETVSINGLEVTIDSAKFVNGNQYTPAEKGKVLQLEISAINNSDTQQHVYDGDFNVYDMEGNSFQPYFGMDESTISADLNKGKKASGKAFFDVSEADKYEVIYTTFLGTEVKFEVTPQ
jgi:hypothetical protein